MLRRIMVLAGFLTITGCTPSLVDTALMPPSTGLSDPGNAIQYTYWAFASPARTQNDPVSAARAVAALDYLGGVLSTSPSWQFSAPLISSEMVDAREAVRRVLGIAPTAKSQDVVNSMATVASALAQGNRAAALAALNAPIFTLGPEKTLALLTNMPAIRQANIATAHADGALNGTFCALGCFRSGL
jgi:hypothetical protein